mgnify:CR=1 FL=1
MNRKEYNSDPRYAKVLETMDLLSIMDVSTTKQAKNGTIVWSLPVKDQYGGKIHVASFSSGYVRRVKAGGYCPSWQLNKRCESEPQYYGPFENGMYRKYTTRTCKLIPNEVDRLEYLISFCLKNYYIGQANKLSSGKFIPKWKHEHLLSAMEAQVEDHDVKEVQVIIDGHRYKVI